ncbi:MAG: type II CRISPR-associated endonuclease Cas1 [Nitrosospira sp.]|nr:type II CRISPR-associated endonuclease Cas1 [Nitrosospira sp.]
MSEQRILVIENPARLSIEIGRLKIERDGFTHVYISPRDIAVLCLEHHTISMSVAVLRTLAEAGCAVLVTDARHLPAAMLHPFAATGLNAGRLRQQIALDCSELRAKLWKQLVAAKLSTQAATLRELGRNGALRLERLAAQVLPGDKNNAEGQGAKHYWNSLFPDSFRRSKEGATDPLNIRLNYGYAVLRTMIARTLAASGLNAALGLGHANAGNAFNLADDFIEPYRFLVDIHLALDADTWSEVPEFNSHAKRLLLRFIRQPVRIVGQDMRLHAAIEASAASFVRILDGKDTRLLVPEGIVISGDKSWALTAGA